VKECNYCKKLIKEEDAVCPFCSYDPKTGTLSQQVSSVKSLEKQVRINENKVTGRVFGVSPVVKKFVFISLAIVLFSILYKYNFNINIIMSEINQTFARITGKPYKKKGKTIEKIEWVNIRSFKDSKKPIRYRDLTVEGILFDPNGKSFVTVNGEVIPEGESLGNITVKKISKDSVELIVDGETKIIEVKQ
jgi:hypothetical protein